MSGAPDLSATAAYDKPERVRPVGQYVLTPKADAKLPAALAIPPSMPCTTLLVHGVNDVGVGYGEVERGLCAGLAQRLKQEAGCYVPGSYRLPGDQADDTTRVLDDPDAVFFKRSTGERTHSPVIPFYWGFRASEGNYRSGKDLPHGQNLDRYGNRLDKDYSKGGGPFSNATTTLPDLWNKGHGSVPGSGDPIRPTLQCPGRLYMVLAAVRLAALVSMIKDWNPKEVVNLVAHSQGTLLSLLAQALLLDAGRAPADTLILAHSPYGLEDELTDFGVGGGEDAAMLKRYWPVQDRQTLHARLQTLVNLVTHARARRGQAPGLDDGLHGGEHRGLVGTKWQASADRDNRGKVYIYFCPEDLTVGLRSVQGIGWQGVADAIRGQQVVQRRQANGTNLLATQEVVRQPMAELSAAGGFFQRVFTLKKRPDPKRGQPELVGSPAHDFLLKAPGENFYGHAAQMSALWHPAQNAARVGVGSLQDDADPQRQMIRRINAEALATPVQADLYGGQAPDAWECVDPIDAAIAATGDSAYQWVWQVMNDPNDDTFLGRVSNLMADEGDLIDSPAPQVYADRVREIDGREATVKERLNQGKQPGDQTTEVGQVYTCYTGTFSPRASGKLLVKRRETPTEVRRRFQSAPSTAHLSARSFHSAIWASAANHQNVTAYDLAIGFGSAVDDPGFRDYLCAVADWRLKRLGKKGERARPGILTWDKFLAQHTTFYVKEPAWRKALIEGNCGYYSTGVLPDCLPLLPEGLPSMIVCETRNGLRIDPIQQAQPKAPAGKPADKVPPKGTGGRA